MSIDSRQDPSEGPDPRVDHDALLAELEALEGDRRPAAAGEPSHPAAGEAVEIDAEEEPAVEDPEEPASGGLSLGMGIGAGVAIGIAVALVAAILAGLPAPTERVVAVAPSPVVPTAQPASGTDIIRASATGGGTLVLENPGDLDAVVALADSTTYTRAVYVRAGDRVTVPDVAKGTYEIFWTIGYNWQVGRFVSSASYQQLDGSVEFTERDSGSGPEYTRLTLVVQRAADGTAGIVATAPFRLIAP
jgi:hypothetical protein